MLVSAHCARASTGRATRDCRACGSRDGDHRATVLKRALEHWAVDLGGLDTVGLLAIGGVIGGDLYHVLLCRLLRRGCGTAAPAAAQLGEYTRYGRARPTALSCFARRVSGEARRPRPFHRCVSGLAPRPWPGEQYPVRGSACRVFSSSGNVSAELSRQASGTACPGAGWARARVAPRQSVLIRNKMRPNMRSPRLALAANPRPSKRLSRHRLAAPLGLRWSRLHRR